MVMLLCSNSADFAKDTYYRFMKSIHIDWNRFTSMLVTNISKDVIVPTTSDDRVNALIVDDSMFSTFVICGDKGVLESLSASMKAQDNRESVGLISVPLTYFYADPGSLFSPKLADWYKEHVNVPYKAARFKDSDHMLVSNFPEKFAEEVETLLSC